MVRVAAECFFFFRVFLKEVMYYSVEAVSHLLKLRNSA